MEYQPVIAIDFDGVIHQFKQPWRGTRIISDPPVDGIDKVIAELREKGYKVIVVSSRCFGRGGKRAIRKYLKKYNIVVDGVTKDKVGAQVYLDDRAMRFDGVVDDGLVDRITNFVPWNRVAPIA